MQGTSTRVSPLSSVDALFNSPEVRAPASPVGNSFFNDAWVIATASVVGRDGLGPLFNAVSCSGCHHLDGRGRPPDHPDDPLESTLIRLSVIDADGRARPHPVYGEQFQDKAIPGAPAEGRVRFAWEVVPGTYPDGSTYTLRRPLITLHDLGYGPLGDGVRLSARIAPEEATGYSRRHRAPSVRRRCDP